MTDSNSEAHQILNILVSISFEQCQLIDRSFLTMPSHPGLYAVRHHTLGLLYSNPN